MHVANAALQQAPHGPASMSDLTNQTQMSAMEFIACVERVGDIEDRADGNDAAGIRGSRAAVDVEIIVEPHERVTAD